MSVGNLAVFGGGGNRLAVIAADTQKLVIETIPVAIKFIYSLSICPTQASDKKKRVLMAISGKESGYSNNRSDLLDVTPFLEALGVSFENLYKNHNTTDSHVKYKLHKEVWQLESELNTADTSIRLLQAELDAANASRQKLQAKYKQAKASLRELNRRFAEATERIGHSQAKYRHYKAKFRQIRRELHSFKSVKIEPAVKCNGMLGRLAGMRETLNRYQKLQHIAVLFIRIRSTFAE